MLFLRDRHLLTTLCSVHMVLCVFFLSLSQGILIPQMPMEYSVLLSAGSVAPVTSTVGQRQSVLLGNLAPFTPYEIRIQACQNGECLSDTCSGLL